MVGYNKSLLLGSALVVSLTMLLRLINCRFIIIVIIIIHFNIANRKSNHCLNHSSSHTKPSSACAMR